MEILWNDYRGGQKFWDHAHLVLVTLSLNFFSCYNVLVTPLPLTLWRLVSHDVNCSILFTINQLR
jgi:hypothetical protein